jgi:hypothetical protein
MKHRLNLHMLLLFFMRRIADRVAVACLFHKDIAMLLSAWQCVHAVG